MTKEKQKALKAHIKKGKDGKLVAVASTEDTDRMGDVLRAGGWKLKNFKKNPVLQFAHNYSIPPIGIAKNIKVKGKKLFFEPVFHEITQLAREVKSMYESTPPIMTAFSVGFVPLKTKPIEKKGQVVGQEILESELLEISAVPVPANPAALSIPKSYEPEVKNQVQEWVKDAGGKWVRKEEEKEDEKPVEESEDKPKVEPETKPIEETEEKEEEKEEDNEEVEEKEEKDCGCKEEKEEEVIEDNKEEKEEEDNKEEVVEKEEKEETDENEEEKKEDVEDLVEGKEEKINESEEGEESEFEEILTEEEKEEKDGKPQNVSEKPYPTEHSCRLKDPDDFESGSFRSTTREHEGKKYRIIMGKLKGEDEMTEQAYRYNKDVWSESSAKSHCNSHDGIRFEPAEEEKAMKEKEIKELEKKVKDILKRDIEIREGRVLSGSNRKRIIDAKEQLEKSISVLDGLLEASEPNNGEGKSQNKGRKRVVRKRLEDRVMVQALQNIAKEVNTTLFKVKNK